MKGVVLSDLAKVRVAGSNPVVRSIETPGLAGGFVLLTWGFAWDAKIDVLLETAPSVVSFAFGSPPRSLLEALEGRRVAVGVTVTSMEEAATAAHEGAGFLWVQGHEAGAHRGTFDNPSLMIGRYWFWRATSWDLSRFRSWPQAGSPRATRSRPS